MENLLQQIGFSDKEAKVYLANLELSKATAFQIAQKTELKRPTVYVILDELVKKGFISIEKTPKVTYYMASHPKKILTDLKNKEKKIEDNLINLESIYNLQTEKPKIQTFEGVESVEKIYDEMADYARLKGKKVLIFGTIAFLKNIHPDQYKYWLNSIKSKKSNILELLTPVKENQEYLKDLEKFKNPNHQIRLIPEENKNIFENDNLIYGNKVVIISSYRDFFAIVIENERIANTFKAIHEMAWKTAKPIKS